MAIVWNGDAVIAEIDRRALHNVELCGEVLRDLVAEEAPKDTNKLAESGIVVIDPDDITASVIFGLGLRTNYGFFQEFGPANGQPGGPPNPYFSRALARFFPDARRLMGGS